MAITFIDCYVAVAKSVFFDIGGNRAIITAEDGTVYTVRLSRVLVCSAPVVRDNPEISYIELANYEFAHRYERRVG